MMIVNLTMLRFNRFALNSFGIKHQHNFLPDNRLTLAVEAAFAPALRPQHNPINSLHGRIALIYRLPKPWQKLIGSTQGGET
jgi:hypothetical protein